MLKYEAWLHIHVVMATAERRDGPLSPLRCILMTPPLSQVLIRNTLTAAQRSGDEPVRV